MQPENIIMLSINLLIPNPNQPRKHFNEESLKELAISIKEYGILNPILVRKKENIYEIIAGERRYRAAKIIGLTEVPVIIKNIDENKVSEVALIENLQRESLTAIEEAKTYEKILKNSNITEQRLSELVGKSQPFISNKLRLLKLPEEIKEAINNKKISEKHARSLLTLNDESKQIELLNKIIKEKLSVKELDNLINDQKEEKESDNMNDGNFFPNYNTNDQTNNMSLNQMNMQTIESQNSMPTFENTPVTNNPLPQVEIQNMEPNSEAVNSIMPDLNTNISSPIPDFGVNNNAITENTIQNEVKPSVTEPIIPKTMEIDNINSNLATSDTPLFGETPVVTSTPTDILPPLTEPIPTPVINQTTNLPIEETPLFNQEINNSSQQPNLNESFYEVPVNVSPVIESPQADKFTMVSELLSSNNIEYKAYSNETGHCIIIEL